MPDGPRRVAALVAAIEPFDDVERAHQTDVLAWLASTPDVYRRVRPATPPSHLVSYAVLTDPGDWSVFLVDHRLAGLWLPAGGHVEPGEEPAGAGGPGRRSSPRTRPGSTRTWAASWPSCAASRGRKPAAEVSQPRA